MSYSPINRPKHSPVKITFVDLLLPLSDSSDVVHSCSPSSSVAAGHGWGRGGCPADGEVRRPPGLARLVDLPLSIPASAHTTAYMHSSCLHVRITSSKAPSCKSFRTLDLDGVQIKLKLSLFLIWCSSIGCVSSLTWESWKHLFGCNELLGTSSRRCRGENQFHYLNKEY